MAKNLKKNPQINHPTFLTNLKIKVQNIFLTKRILNTVLKTK